MTSDFTTIQQLMRPDVLPVVSPEALYVVPAILLCGLTVVAFFASKLSDITFKSRHPYRPLKLLIALLLTFVQGITAFLELYAVDTANGLHVIALCMPSVATFSLLLDTYYGRRTPLLLDVYMFLQLLTDAVRTWSYWSPHSVVPLSVLGYTAAAFRTLWLFSDFLTSVSRLVISLTKSFLSEIFREVISDTSLRRRLSHFVFLGFEDLQQEEKLPELDDTFKSAELSRHFDYLWARANKLSKYALLRTCARVLMWQLVSTAPLRICYVACQLYQIQIMRRVIAMLPGGSIVDDSKCRVIFEAIMASAALLIVGVWRDYKTGRFDVLLRGLLSSIILKKTFGLGSDYIKNHEVDAFSSTDVNVIMEKMSCFHTFWLAPMEIALGVYFFYLLEGAIVWFLFPPLIMGSATGYFIGLRLNDAMEAWKKAAQKRDLETTSIVSEIKGIKMLGVENQVMQYLRQFQEREILSWRDVRFYGLLTWMSFVWVADVPAYAVISGGIFWQGTIEELTAATAFDILALTMTIVIPAIAFMRHWPTIKLLVTTFGQIQEFLFTPELCDQRYISRSLIPPVKETFRCFVGGIQRRPVAYCRGVTISPSRHRGPLFFDFGICVYEATTLMITGPSGSGKTTLLKAFLGEAIISQGSVFLYIHKQSIAYCGHDAWLQDTSIRQNIIGKEAFDREWYQQVVQGCMLLEDFENWPGRDNFGVGKNGTRLSGGQCHRVALARAIYPRPSILVVDDIFSVLDPQTCASLFEKLFGSAGLLNKWNITVILATRSIQYLPLAHQVVFISKSRDVRVANGGLQIAPIWNELLQDQSTQSVAGTGSVNNHLSTNDPVAEPSKLAQQVPAEDPVEVDAPLYFYLTKGISKISLAFWIILISLHAIMERTAGAFLRVWADVDPSNLSLFWVYTIVVWLRPLVVALDSWLYHIVLIPQSALEFHKEVLNTVFKASLPVLMSIEDGVLFNRIVNDVAMTSKDFPMMLKGLIYGCAIISVDLCFVIDGIPHVVFFVPLLLFSGYWIKVFYFRALKQLRLLGDAAKKVLYSKNTEMRAGLEHIRAMGWQEYYTSKSFSALDEFQRIHYARFQLQAWVGVYLHLITSVMMVTATTLAVTMADVLSPAGAALAFFFAQFSCSELQSFFGWITSFGDSALAAARIRAFVAGIQAVKQQPDFQLRQSWPEHGEVVFKSMDATYQISDVSHMVLQGVSLTIQPRCKVGIIGRTGSGKSTLILTLLGFLKYQGSITIDDVELSNIPENQLQSHITTIPQRAVTLPGNVRDNILPWDLAKSEKSVPDHVIIRVLGELGLAHHVELYGGLDMPIQDMRFSLGQRQLIGIARAILEQQVHKTHIICIDEATSGLHDELEKEVHELMGKAFAECTVFTVTHKISLLESMDIIAEFRDGKLISRRDQ